MRITERRHGTILVLTLHGKLDTVSAERLQDSLLGRIRAGQRQVILDASEMTYISSTGLRILFLASQELRDSDDRIAICGLNQRLKGIFSTTGFADMFALHDSLSEATAAMEGSE